MTKIAGRKTTHRWHAGFEIGHGGAISGAQGWDNTSRDIVDSANLPKASANGTVVGERFHLVLSGNTAGIIEVGLPGTTAQYARALYTRANIDQSNLFVPVADGKKMRILGTDAGATGSASIEGWADYPKRAISPRTIPTGAFTVVGGNPAVIDTTTPHGLVTGDRIRIADNTSDTSDLVANNGWWTVTVTDENTFTVPVNIGDGAGAVSDGTIEIWSRSTPTIDNEGALLAELRNADNTNQYATVARILPGEKILLTGIHLAKQEAAAANRYAELVIANSVTVASGIITAVPASAVVLARTSGTSLFMDCHIELGGNYVFSDGPGSSGLWLLLRNVDNAGGGGTSAFANCLLKFNKSPGTSANRSVSRFGSTTTTAIIYAVPAESRFVVRHAMVDALATTEATIWIDGSAVGADPLAIVSSRAGIVARKTHIRIYGGTLGKSITLTCSGGSGECRGYIDGYFEKLAP